MNLIAQQALARADARCGKPVPVAAVLLAEPVSVPAPEPLAKQGHFDRVGYIEGRRHALDIVRDNRLLIDLQGDRDKVIGRLRQCMQDKPASFAKGVADIVELVEREVNCG